MKIKLYNFSFILMLSMWLVLPIETIAEPMFKPMYLPNNEEALISDYIVIAEYQGYKQPLYGKIDYFNSPIVQYKILRALKGARLSKILNVNYAFHDGSSCLPLEGWKFSENLLPKVGSKWLLFINRYDAENEIYYTYRGDFGCWEATGKNISDIERKLKNKKIF